MSRPGTAPPPAALPAPGRNRQVDAWRACACLAVVGAHSAVLDGLDRMHPIIATLSPYLKHGWLGVPVFFMLSGYCLSHSLQKRVEGGGRTMLHFWTDRLLRIFPTYWAALLLTCLLAWAATHFNGLPAASAWPASLLHALADVTLTNVWWQPPARLSVSWSLDYEIGFYIMIGFALAWPGAKAIHRLVVCGLITAIAHLPVAVGYLPLLGFWPQFACGIAVHAAATSTFPHAVRLLALGYPVCLCAMAIANGPPWSWFAPASALLFFFGLKLSLRLPSPPEFAVRLGQASYSIYLVHLPLMHPLLNLSRRFAHESDWLFAVMWIAHILTGVLGGVLFFHAVEKPLERWRARAVLQLRAAHPRPSCLATHLGNG